MCSLCQDLSDGTINFDHLTLTFDLHLENFNSAHNFLAIRHRAFILGKSVLYDKTFPMALYILIMWHWPWPLTYIWKNIDSVHNFLTIRHRAFIFGVDVPYIKTFLLLLPVIVQGPLWSIVALCGNTSFDRIHIKYHIEMSPLMPHAFLGMPPIYKSFTLWSNRCRLLCFLCHLWSIAAHRDHFVRCLCVCVYVCLSGSYTFFVVAHSCVSQATHAFLGMLPLCFCLFFTIIVLLFLRSERWNLNLSQRP